MTVKNPNVLAKISTFYQGKVIRNFFPKHAFYTTTTITFICIRKNKNKTKKEIIIVMILITYNQVISLLDDRILSRKLFNNKI